MSERFFHEVENGLQVILGYAELTAGDENITEKQVARLKIIASKCIEISENMKIFRLSQTLEKGNL